MKKLTKTLSVKILECIRKMKNKSCLSDPIPTFILKQCADLLSPVLAYTVNKSFDESNVPSNLKHVIVTPVIKDKNGNQDKYQNYRPVSNLPFVSKLSENIELHQIQEHLWDNNLYGKYQSGYQQFHSCETALLKVLSDIQKSIYEKEHVVLILLDLSSAFDTIDHKILIDCLKNKFLITGSALRWIQSYLKNRTFSVSANGTYGQNECLLYGVPQGSLHGPLFYILYTKDLEKIVAKHGLSVQMYADDTQIYTSFTSENVGQTKIKIENCLSEINNWMCQNYLKINQNKTEVIVFRPTTKVSIALFDSINIKFESEMLGECNFIKVLRVILSNNMSMVSFISKKSQICAYHLENIRHIKKCLPHKY